MTRKKKTLPADYGDVPATPVVEEAPTPFLTIDYSPLEKFRYDQISNHKFEFMLVNHELKVVHSPFECKDYLQDIFWCEVMKRKSTVWGLSWKPGMFDITTEYFYLAVNGGSEIMSVRVKPLQAFLNAFEEKLGIPLTVIYETDNTKIIVLKFSREWTINGPMLSAYTTLIRAAGAYQEGDVLEYLVKLYAKEIKAPAYVEVERVRLAVNLPKLAGLLEGKRPTDKWENTSSIGGAHDYGITSCFGFPTGTVPNTKVEA